MYFDEFKAFIIALAAALLVLAIAGLIIWEAYEFV